MNNIKTEFTIKDLENFSGIKAHTIRIWEKRYNLLSPNRTDSNIRFYDTKSLLKLLNIALLNNAGLKISKIAKLSDSEILVKVREQEGVDNAKNHSFNTFKLAMLNFDEQLFNSAYNKLLEQNSFREVFKNVFIPFLSQIGVLWQLDSITPAHEHFISNLIQNKLHANIDRLQSSVVNQHKVFVLYLPMNEIHDLGLLYLHYELLLHGNKSIFLGQSVPTENLKDLQKLYNDINFVVYLTVEPLNEPVFDFLKNVYDHVLKGSNDNLSVLGSKIMNQNIDVSSLEQIQIYENIETLLKKIK